MYVRSFSLLEYGCEQERLCNADGQRLVKMLEEGGRGLEVQYSVQGTLTPLQGQSWLRSEVLQ